MKKIGIVGGVGWRSTLEYYREICHCANEPHLARGLAGMPPTPEIVIESLDLAKSHSLLGNDDDERSWRGFDEYYRAALQRVETSGAEVALLASNTPHHRFDEIVRGVKIPVISILDAAAKEASRIGMRRVLILGTALMMRSERFRAAFAKHGIELVAPRSTSAQAAIVALIENLQRGRIKGAVTRLGKIAVANWPFAGEPVVCLARTELSMAVPVSRTKPRLQASFKYGGVTYISTMGAHIGAVLESVGMQ
jgi:aspartate racemase